VDASLPLVFPNPSLGINLTLAGLALAGIGWISTGSGATVVWFAALVALQLAMFVIGALYTDNRAASAASVLVAPCFLIWKMTVDLAALFVGLKEWKRTAREL
jgi:hypothetical protein